MPVDVNSMHTHANGSKFSTFCRRIQYYVCVDIFGSRAFCVCSYESACEEYLKALDLLRSSEEADMGPVPKSYIGNFIVNRVRP